MARYPDSPAPQGTGPQPWPWKLTRPLARGGPSWAQRTRALTPFDLWVVDLTYVALSWTNVKILIDFWQLMGGGNGTFTFADFNGYEKGNSSGPGVPWTGLYVGKGTGAQTDWDLPTFILQTTLNSDTPPHLTDPVVKVAGVTKAALTLYPTTTGADGYVRVGGGTDGLDKIHFASAPASSALITIDATCRRAMRVAKFSTDEFPFQTRNPANLQGGVVTIVEQVP